MVYWIIEHSTRGFFTYLDYDIGGEPKPHFSPTAMADDERVEKFFHPHRARKMLDKIPPNVRAKCSLKRIS